MPCGNVTCAGGALGRLRHELGPSSATAARVRSASCKVDLAPYRSRVVVVHRGAGAETGAERWDLPGTVPTHPQDAPAQR